MERSRQIALWIIGIAFVLVGAYHFINPDFFLAIMPPYLPYHLQLVYLSGIFEILGGIGILIPKTRKWAGYGLIALLFAVFPANIHMAVNPDDFADIAPAWALYLRLPLQFVIMAAVFWASRDGQDNRDHQS